MKIIITLLFLFITLATTAQTPLFYKTVDSINAIIKADPSTYYCPKNQYDAFVKSIVVASDGVVSFTDSIPKTEIPKKKPELISDCCPQKKTRTLDLLSVKKWEINFPTAYLKNESGETIGRFVGVKEADLYKLKKQFENLRTFFKKK